MKSVSIFTFISAGLLTACASVSMDVPDKVSDPAVDVANAPLETLNIKKIEIPDNLQTMTHPYEPLSKGATCQDVLREVVQLNDFLGIDQDDPSFETEGNIKAGDLAKMLIPYGGPIRFLSGATTHQKDVLRAARLGAARRAYLKAQGEDMGCKYPASPLNQ